MPNKWTEIQMNVLFLYIFDATGKIQDFFSLF